MLITNATLLTPSERAQVGAAHGAMRLDRGRIVAMGRTADISPVDNEPVFDAQGLILAPGFIDLQLNGGFGHDFTQEPTTIWQVAKQLPRYGVTGFLPTIITSPLATIRAAQQVLEQEPSAFDGATPLGLHLEGPFLNSEKKGAHNAQHLQSPDLAPAELASEWSPQRGVRLVTLAPELPGALDLVRRLVANGVLVGAGHSLATLQEAEAAIQAGVRYGTHLFNAMPTLHHRDPGLAAALLGDERVSVGLIADGVHVHPAVIRLVWRLLGADRLNLVTDAMAALGMPASDYQLGDQVVRVGGQRATLPDGTLAGSVLSLDAALRNLMRFTGCSPAEAIQTVTSTPARLLALDHKKGRIAPGYDADLVLLTEGFEVASAFIGGRLVFDRRE